MLGGDVHNHRLAALFAPMLLAFSLNAAAQAADEWITINKDYSSQRYVDLDQINRSNARALKEVCEPQLNEASWYNSGLLMVGRTIYTATLRATYAIDATTCEVRWRNVLKLAGLSNISTRGPAYLDGAIFRGTADGPAPDYDLTVRPGESLYSNSVVWIAAGAPCPSS
jgi:hypothetical protein